MQKVLGNKKRGQLFILSAPAGTGKTTLMEMLSAEFSSVVASISFTTRAPREDEEDGIHYNFVSREAFEKKIAEGDFLEHVTLYGDYYGTSRAWVEKRLAEGKHVVLVIDTQGTINLRNQVAATFIFVKPPSLKELRVRLLKRRTESNEVIQKRLNWAAEEMERAKLYDYTLINDDLDTAYQVLRSIVIAEEHRVTQEK